MEDGINQLFHPAYPLPPQHQPFPDNHEVVQDQYHRMFSTSSQPLTHHPHSTAPHIYGYYNRPPPSTNDHPPTSAAPTSPPRNEPQSPFSQNTSPPSHTPQPEPPIDDEPLYVNAKQYYRILKRRIARARLEEVHRLSQKRKVVINICLWNVEHLQIHALPNSHISMNRATNMQCVAREGQVAASSLQKKSPPKRPPHLKLVWCVMMTTIATMEMIRHATWLLIHYRLPSHPIHLDQWPLYLHRRHTHPHPYPPLRLRLHSSNSNSSRLSHSFRRAPGLTP
jgi:hypothetical protein